MPMIHLAPDGQIYSKMTGQPINTVDDISQYGSEWFYQTESIICRLCGYEWYGTNQTNVKVPGMDGKTYNDLATGQLIRNKLPETGSTDIPRGRK